MAALLPFVFLLISLLGFAAILPPRAAVLKAAALYGVVVVLNTELLSLVSLLEPWPLGIIWIAECALAAVLVLRHRAAAIAFLHRTFQLPRLGFLGWAAAFGIAFIAVATAAVALVAPPNTFDSMTYHMARVAHWVSDHAVASYPTNITRQLYEPPWGEFAILQLQVLSGGDRLANVVQWLAMAGSAVGVSRIGQQLGATPRGQLIAAIAVVTLPMGILQATSTQTDYAEAFWLVCVVSFALEFVAAPSVVSAWWLGAALGLAALTKGTAYVFAAPAVLMIAAWAVLRLRRRVLAPAAVLVAVPLLINLGQYARNEAVFGNPLADPVDNRSYVNQTFAPAAIASNIIRDSVLQVGTPFASVDNLVSRVIVDIHTRVLHFDVNDPRTTWPGVAFAANPTSLDEDFAGDPLQAVLAAIATAAAIAIALRGGARDAGIYAAGLVVGFVLFAAYLRWQPWNSRLELPLLVLAAPLVGLYAGRIRNAAVIATLGAVLLVGAMPWTLDNASRPLVQYQVRRLAHYLGTGQSILNTPRLDVYFAKRHDLEGPYLNAVAQAQAAGCHDIGLWAGADDWEYPLWIVDPGVRVDQIEVQNASAQLAVRGAAPCLLVVTVPNPPQTITVDGQTFTKSSDENGVAVYKPEAKS